jgi:NADPH:quinone reductase-like Zn-dependent oxidoreductase
LKALVHDKTGNAIEVLQLREVPEPKPAFRQVRVRMLASPINPSDILTIQGGYAATQALPAIPGYEGAGVVEESGGGVLGWLRKGKRVALISQGGGCWAEQVVVSARQIVPVPAGIPDEQAATFFVNPVTALAMTRHVLKVSAGAWLLQTAAGSALGQMVIRLGKSYGFRTINIVRRPEQVDELKRLGADEVIRETTESIAERVNAITQGKGVRFVIDAVGGKTGSAAVHCMAVGGKALLYGVLSGQSLEIDPRFLITGSKSVQGFWLSDWLRMQKIPTLLGTFRQVRKLMGSGVIKSDFAGVYSLADYQKAVQHVQSAARGGKVAFKIPG